MLTSYYLRLRVLWQPTSDESHYNCHQSLRGRERRNNINTDHHYSLLTLVKVKENTVTDFS